MKNTKYKSHTFWFLALFVSFILFVLISSVMYHFLQEDNSVVPVDDVVDLKIPHIGDGRNLNESNPKRESLLNNMPIISSDYRVDYSPSSNEFIVTSLTEKHEDNWGDAVVELESRGLLIGEENIVKTELRWTSGRGAPAE